MTPSGAMPAVPVYVRRVSPADLEGLLPALVELLCESVDRGASLGFLRPLDPDDAVRYWRSLPAELRAGSRMLFGAYASSDRLVGCGQLALAQWPNAPHRAEVQKVVVASACQGRGVGRCVVDAIHDAAREIGRSLLLLNTRRGDGAETFYRRLGYRAVGVIPRYTIDSGGKTHDNLTLYRNLGP